MDTDRNEHQIIRKDARACFVKTLNDSFEFSKVHFCFASYDMKLPAGQRQTNSVHIYVAVDEFLGLCQKMASGELRYMIQQRKKDGSNDPLYRGEKLPAIEVENPGVVMVLKDLQHRLIDTPKGDFKNPAEGRFIH